MPARVEKDVVIILKGREPGSETDHLVEVREGDRDATVTLHANQYGSEVSLKELREAVDFAEAEFLR